VFVALAAFIFGPLSGVAVCFVKEFIAYLTKSTTGGIGEIANFTVITGYIIIPAVVYCYKKGLLTVIVTLIIGCLVQVALALLCNRFIMFPMFFGTEAATFFGDLWVFVACFNLIKSVAISVVTIILYKRISGFIKGI
jgi:riboflavin transporter FmnP